MFKPNLNEIPRGKYKSEEQKSALENIKLFSKSPESVIRLSNDCYLIASDAKFKVIHGKGISSMPVRMARGKFSDHSNLKMLSPKQMLQILTIALLQVKAGKTSKSLPMKSEKIIYSLYQTKEITKKVYNNIMNSIKM